MCGEITSDFPPHVVLHRKMTKEEAAGAKEIAVEKKSDNTKNKEEQPEATEEEEETCGFCAYMKGGSCKQEFVCWEKCVDQAKANEEDFVAKCFEETTALRECMMKDPGYYGEMEEEDKDDEGGGGDDDDKRKRSENNKSSSESSRKDRSSEKEQKR